MGFELTEVVLGSHDTLYEKCARMCMEMWVMDINWHMCFEQWLTPASMQTIWTYHNNYSFDRCWQKKNTYCNYEAFLVVNPSDFIYQSSHCRTSIGWSTLQGPETSPARCSQQCTGQFDLTCWTIHHPQAQRGPTLWIWTQHLDLRFWYWYLLHLCGLPPLWIWV